MLPLYSLNGKSHSPHDRGASPLIRELSAFDKSLPPELVSFPSTAIPGTGFWTHNRTTEVYGFKRWTYVAINCIAECHAEAIPMIGFRDQKTGEVEEAPYNHPLSELLREPNPRDVFWQLEYLTKVYYHLTGVAYWLIKRNHGLPAEIWVLPSHWVWPDWSHGRLNGYRVYPNYGKQMYYDVDDIIEFSKPNPINPLDAISAAWAGDNWVDTSQSLDWSRYNYFMESILPSIIIELTGPYAGGEITEDEMKRLKAKLQERFQGPTKAGSLLVLKAGAKATLVESKREMHYMESSEQIRDMVLSLWRVPKILAGIPDDVNRASSITVRQIFARYTLLPDKTLFSQVGTRRLAKRYSEDCVMYYDDPIPIDPADVTRDLESDARVGAITYNEHRQARNRDPWPPEFEDNLGEKPMKGEKKESERLEEETPEKKQ